MGKEEKIMIIEKRWDNDLERKKDIVGGNDWRVSFIILFQP